MNLALQVMILILGAAQVGILGYTWVFRPHERLWTRLVLFGVVALTITLLMFIPDVALPLSRYVLVWVGLILLSGVFSTLSLNDLQTLEHAEMHRRNLAILVGLWLVGFVVTVLPVRTDFAGWAQSSSALPLAAGAMGLLGYTGYVVSRQFVQFYQATMPELANRSAFWISVVLLLGITQVFVGSGHYLLAPLGIVLLTTLVAILAYGTTQYRLLDVRDNLVYILQIVTAIAAGWVILFGIFYLVERVDLLAQFGLPMTGSQILLMAGIALAAIVLITPIRSIVDLVFSRITARNRPRLTRVIARYTNRVARAASLEEVVNATTETLAQSLGITRSALILINNTFRVEDAVELVALQHGATLANPTAIGYLSKQGQTFHSLAVTQVAIGQFDMDFSPYYRDLNEQERDFFRRMDMSLYVPILAEDRLIGLLAVGGKMDDTPYQKYDVELLSVLSQQISTALRSARLIDDLQHLNDSMRVLNKRLETAKVELQQLDSVKTDFITIASHELRTPLAQIRGYTDIIDSLNEAEALQKDQTSHMVKNLRKSTERMEELISAMLDVSQIDTAAMDLRFVTTSPETILKLAIDPLHDPAGQRDIKIVREGMQGLPQIEADLQRMTQAIRNIVLNAIKFTPDGGTITLSAAHQPKHANGDSVVFEIRDTGVGIAEKDIEYIFQKFYRGFDTQLHSTGIYKFMGAGPGLGLTIAKGIIEGHGGEVWAESVGHDMDQLPGSSFYIRLPLSPPEGSRRVSTFDDDTLAGEPIDH